MHGSRWLVLHHAGIQPRMTDEQLKEMVFQAVRKALTRELDKKPVLIVHVSRAEA